MKRVFGLIVILALSSASIALAQSRRVYRTESPKEERAKESEQKDEKKDEAKDKTQDESQTDDDKVFTGKEVTVRARIKSKPNPGYPREARPHRVQGQVKLRVILDSDGKIRDEIEVLEGLPYGVTEEAIKAARQIEFEPAQKDGRPVSQYVTLIYNFNLY